MAAKKSTNFFWDRFIPTIYALGAAVVILGAMGKIMHYEALAFMLPIGLATEAVIFILYAIQSFLFPPVDYQWERAYPELADDYTGEPVKRNIAPTQGAGLTAKMDDMLANAKISPDIFDNLKSGIQSLTGQVAKMSDLSDATVATSEYAKNVKTASNQVTAMNSAYGTAVTAMNSMADATKDAQEYRAQFGKITQNMGALNAVYELELQDTNKHLKAMNAFYSNLTTAMQDMAEASKETQQFKSEMSKLTNNLSSLNNVYGSMLSAMRGN
ncbi:gliding motility protein GldL [Emticicia sp. C21]|uniref:type IX secretion system motor protein PorL/GldL n=1 Tax=Emticicia sp. C21 TaxID=2302915 RepID=UPI000E356664|nr:gliding motility protein GldL [Emticicia sp. C21]RFS17511.1 gliding motility protein GldL [Emticicia sp. C21]